MEIVFDFFNSLIELSNAMAIYILFGLIFAGILHELVPQSLVTKHLGNGNISSVIKATLFGIPLPVCSCGVIPLAASIKKNGASKGATLSFLISTPITGVDSIMATYGIFGFIFTLYRIISSMIIAIVAGLVINVFDKKEEKQTQKFSLSKNTNTLNSKTATFSSFSLKDEANMKKQTQKFSLLRALKYSFGTLLNDISRPLFFGLILGAIISTIIPENLSAVLLEHVWISYLIVVIIAVPMYVCATASLPIAAALMLSGVSAGAAFVFLSAGPATNIVTMGVVKKMLGSKSLYIYIASIVIGSLAFGLGLDYIFDISNINPSSLINIEENSNFFTILSSLVLWAFILKPYFLKVYLKNKS